jgi:tRNA (guanine26-N2/guanine27-N2)-dimethyltransferase
MLLKNLKEISEGKVKILVPDVKKPEDGEVFYNPGMEFDRNISVCVLDVFLGSKVKKETHELKPQGMKACDSLAATGVRGIRYLAETPLRKVWINDGNKKAVELIKKNLKLNKIKSGDVEVTNEDVNNLLRREKFDFVDIDPFGSPVPFLDSAARSFKKEGFLAITATDTAPLCGTYPKVALRRYGVKSLKTDYFKELGIRILISKVMKIFGSYDKIFIPKLSYSRRHYFRVYGEVKSGTEKADKILEQFGFISQCFSCGWRDLGFERKCLNCGKDTEIVERIYLGNIQDKEFCKKVLEEIWKRGFRKEERLIRLLIEELEIPFYYDVHNLCKKSGKCVKNMQDIFSRLKEKAHRVSRTHFCPTGIKSDAPFSDILESI